MTVDVLDPRVISLDGWNARKVATNPDDELVASVRAQGILEPIGVTRRGEEIVCVYGFRRLRAALALELDEVPVVVVEGTDDDMAFANLAENYHRKNLRPHELCEAVHELHIERGFTHEEIATRIGISSEYAFKLLRVRKRLAPVIWEQFVTWGPTLKVPFSDLYDLCQYEWTEQVERWNLAHDHYNGARRGNEYKPGPAKVRKMLAKVNEHPESFPEGSQFAAGVRYALRVVTGQEAWRHGGVASLAIRRARAKKRAIRKGTDHEQEERNR